MPITKPSCSDGKYVERLSSLLTISLYVIMFLYALSVTIMGSLMPVLIDFYKLKLNQGGMLITVQSIGGIIAIAAGIVLTDKIRKSSLVLFVFILYSLVLLLIALAPSFLILTVIFLILGASTKMLDAVLNAYISDLHPGRRSFFLTLLHACFGIGAFIGPMFSTFLLGMGAKWNQVFLFLGIACGFISLLYCTVNRSSAFNAGHAPESKVFSLFEVIKNPKILVLCLIMFAYAGHQSGMTIWLPTYLINHLNAGTFLSSLALSLFWGGIILGRLTCSVISGRVDAKYIILSGSLLGGLILYWGIKAESAEILIVSSALAGFLTGAVIPLLVSIACGLHPRNSGAASSMIFLYGSLAWMVFPWMMGSLEEYIGFKAVMLFTAFTLTAIVPLSVLIPSGKDRKT